MKLSEAIMMNGMTKPQGFGPNSMYSVDAPCAIGGALQVEGVEQGYDGLHRLWRWVGDGFYSCPACHYLDVHRTWPSIIIAHLNDQHHWTRSQIAEWVASIEPADSEITKEHTAPVENVCL